MLATITKPVMNEYEAQRQYLATANIGIVELVEKTMQMLLFVKENHIGKDEMNE